MATPNEKFASALKVLKSHQDNGEVAIHTNEIANRTYRELLVKHGFIKEVTKGWYITTHPSEQPGETTSWYSSYWEFCAKFLESKYGSHWCLSPDQSMKLHAGD